MCLSQTKTFETVLPEINAVRGGIELTGKELVISNFACFLIVIVSV